MKISDKELDYLFPQAKVPPVELRGYEWKVIVDPTRDGDDPGMFFGKLFRMLDFRLDRDEKSTWPDGIVFEHITTGSRLTFEEGILIDLVNNKVIGRKPRKRDQNRYLKSSGIEAGVMKKKKRSTQPSVSQISRFLLIREKDLTGVSGTGEVAEGAVFTNGMVVICWLREPFAMGVYQTLEDLLFVHGHEGQTQVKFIDQGETK